MDENEEKKEELYDVEVTDITNEAEESVESEVVSGIYTTGDVSKATGVTREMIRYYINEFSSFLHINQTKGKHHRINEEDFELLKMIVHLAKSGKKVAEIKGILRDPEQKIVFAGKSSTEQLILNLLADNNQQLITSLARILIENQEKQNRLLLEERSQAELDKEAMLNEIEELKQQIQKQNELYNQKEEENALYNAQLKEQIEKQNELLEKIAEQTNKKKFFWQR